MNYLDIIASIFQKGRNFLQDINKNKKTEEVVVNYEEGAGSVK